jgi:predicted LPLAT superfamily acyltransferase
MPLCGDARGYHRKISTFRPCIPLYGNTFLGTATRHKRHRRGSLSQSQVHGRKEYSMSVLQHLIDAGNTIFMEIKTIDIKISTTTGRVQRDSKWVAKNPCHTGHYDD